MKIRNLVLGTAVAAGAFVALAVPASAYIACNGAGDCWHVRDRYSYQPAFGVTVHDDHWRWNGDRYRWREHEGRGYWRNGAWITF